jgi:hypothetical protein
MISTYLKTKYQKSGDGIKIQVVGQYNFAKIAKTTDFERVLAIAKKKNYKYVVCLMDVGFKQYYATNDTRDGNIIMWRQGDD